MNLAQRNYSYNLKDVLMSKAIARVLGDLLPLHIVLLRAWIESETSDLHRSQIPNIELLFIEIAEGLLDVFESNTTREASSDSHISKTHLFSLHVKLHHTSGGCIEERAFAMSINKEMFSIARAALKDGSSTRNSSPLSCVWVWSDISSNGTLYPSNEMLLGAFNLSLADAIEEHYSAQQARASYIGLEGVTTSSADNKSNASNARAMLFWTLFTKGGLTTSKSTKELTKASAAAVSSNDLVEILD